MSASPDLRPDPPAAFALRDHALLADGERGAVLDPHGEIGWLCAPSWDSPPVFSALLGGPGRLRVSPVGRAVWGGWYEPGSLVWRNRWVTDTHVVVECRDALVHPGDPDRRVLLRRLTVRQGTARVRVELELPATPLSAAATGVHHGDDGSWTARSGSLHARFALTPDSGDSRDNDLGVGRDGLLSTHCEVREGGTLDVVLEIGTRPNGAPVDVAAAWAGTAGAWADRVPRLPDVLDEADARHSAAVLCGMTSASGAMVAAHHRAAGARRAGPQLRLPVRLDPRPGLPGQRRVQRGDGLPG